MNKNIDLNEIKKIINNIIKDKKKREYLLLIIIVIFILFLLVSKKFNTEITTEESIYSEETTNINISEEISEIYVDISGEVNIPGVYKVDSNTRLFQVIEMAGGLTELANIDAINQAEIVYDGQKIIVEKIYEEDSNSSSNNKTSSGKVSINTADLETLETLPGIGSTKAQRIIDYRTSNGKFKSIEEIKNVSGIGDSTYESIKNLICL